MRMNKLLILLTMLLSASTLSAASKYDNPDTIIVARDGTGEFRTAVSYTHLTLPTITAV